MSSETRLLQEVLRLQAAVPDSDSAATRETVFVLPAVLEGEAVGGLALMKWPTVSDNPNVQAHYERLRHRGESHGIAEICASRKAPGGHETYWSLGHESISSGVPKGMAREHADWVRNEGLTGVEVQKDGTVKTSSPRNREKYLKARGLADQGSAGAGQYKRT